jgi:hypothetical protein
MPEQLTADALIEALRNRGDARGDRWPDNGPDYIAEYSLTAEHIPALISLATQWIDEPSEADVVYGPVHAWRALGQLRAVEAVQPLLDVQDDLAEIGDTWYLEEFHYVFGLIGPPAIEPLKTYLADTSHGESPRGKAAHGLREIVDRFPEEREEIVAILSAELARGRRDTTMLNGFLVGYLADLHAVEAAEEIERAFAANIIDPTVAGDWGDIREELGVPGLGLAPDRSLVWPSLWEQFDFRVPADDLATAIFSAPADDPARQAADRKKVREEKRQAKARRKERARSRRRNRKPR